MSDDWKPGDLALCLKMGDWETYFSEDPSLPDPATDPEPGRIYTVDEVLDDPDEGEILGISGFMGAYYVASRFRKIHPHTPDEQDEETIRLLTGAPVGEPA